MEVAFAGLGPAGDPFEKGVCREIVSTLRQRVPSIGTGRGFFKNLGRKISRIP